jgi:hypothetical protein
MVVGSSPTRGASAPIPIQNRGFALCEIASHRLPLISRLLLQRFHQRQELFIACPQLLDFVQQERYELLVANGERLAVLVGENEPEATVLAPSRGEQGE